MPEHIVDPQVAIVVIGRNEGARLVRCLNSVTAHAGRVVYVDSGSTDGSVAVARAAGAAVVQLDLSDPFTAARARNAGIAALRQAGTLPDYIQFVDGDCEVQPGWIAAGTAFLNGDPRAAVVSGRLRERFPQASVYNRLCDAEWNTPLGEAQACGGIALIRATALVNLGGFNPALIAGEEPELCFRMRQKGWLIWRIDCEMALHDAAMMRFSQWWTRSRRGGYAAAEGVALHGTGPDRLGVATMRRAVVWGLVLPVATLLSAVFVTPWALSLLLAYPAQIVRLARRFGGTRFAWTQASFLVLGKFAEAAGILEQRIRKLTGKPTGIIEYK